MKKVICGFLIGVLVSSGISIYASNIDDDTNIEKAIYWVTRAEEGKTANQVTNRACTSIAYSNIEIAKQLELINKKIDKLEIKK